MIPNDFRLLAEEVAGPKHQGKLRGKVGWHRSQTGVVSWTLETILGRSTVTRIDKYKKVP